TSSTHNTRIERMWVEVGRHFCRSWRAFFLRLERCHGLDRHNPHHLWLLHTLFLGMINTDCHAFQAHWNAHPVSGPNTHDMSPQDLRFLGQAENGLYADDCRGLSEEEIHEYYGTTPDAPVRRRAGQTGAGHPPEEEEESDEDTSGIEAQDTLLDDIALSQEANVRHPSIPVPTNSCPFPDAEYNAVFCAALNTLRSQGTVPAGYGGRADEQEGGFEETEVIRYGRRRRKELEVALSESTWQPRVILWIQGLHVMSHILYQLADEQ
ncbi:hypothetical protein FKP32DRAFT_1568515, partial [Trametes sanguinea]